MTQTAYLHPPINVTLERDNQRIEAEIWLDQPDSIREALNMLVTEDLAHQAAKQLTMRARVRTS